jgi:NADPH:quinone reductase-like Zn-dependent oxidoreductase
MKVAAVKKPGGLANMKIEERASRPPGPGEIRVRIRASSLNFHDLAVVMGMIPTPDGRIPMSDGAGDVLEAGAGVTQWKAGDKVLGLFFPNWSSGQIEASGFASVPGDGADGFGAEEVTMAASAFTRMPKNYTYEEAATLPCAALTAWRGMFVENKVKPGDIVLTQGTGGVSIFALQFAKAAGARVIATTSSDEKGAKLKALGADHVINYKTHAEWGKEAMRLTDGRGVDEVVEIGGPGTLAQSIAACRPGAHISLIGVLTGVSGDVPTAAFFSKNLTMSGITVGSRRHQDDMIEAIEANGIKPVISDRFPLDQIAAAFGHQAAQKHFGKIVLTI